MIKIAITDDHPLILEGFSKMLRNHDGFEMFGAFMNASETRNGISDQIPDVLLLDINLPDDDGVALCEYFKQRNPAMKIIALTSFLDLAIIKSFMSKGGDGYLIKTVTPQQLMDAIHTVMKGELFLHPDIQKTLLAGKAIQQKSFVPKLTRREKEVLILIIQELTTSEIAEKLFISAKTVETHRQNLLSKLSCRNSAGLVKVAFERGLV